MVQLRGWVLYAAQHACWAGVIVHGIWTNGSPGWTPMRGERMGERMWGRIKRNGPVGFLIEEEGRQGGRAAKCAARSNPGLLTEQVLAVPVTGKNIKGTLSWPGANWVEHGSKLRPAQHEEGEHRLDRQSRHLDRQSCQLIRQCPNWCPNWQPTAALVGYTRLHLCCQVAVALSIYIRQPKLPVWL